MICPGTNRDGTVETRGEGWTPRLYCVEGCGRSWTVIGSDRRVPYHTRPDGPHVAGETT